ncbi:hypothetical protein [Streptomyces halobius]|uniref:Uncharacterized protein n=1 Tax=Streptomyces halobius TaxID=2879846 RepID=A0ABY4MDD3_9ACTN|nr:hypothetical protein [Streptomyces halobius]UQA94420.1 hypothetical protein K9S39_23440 [Streptomyces halobius]
MNIALLKRPRVRRIAAASLIAATALGTTATAVHAATSSTDHTPARTVAAKPSVSSSPGGKQETAERSQGQDGVTGTLSGTLTYLAPGKLTVVSDSGEEQAFFVSTDTKVRYGTESPTLAQLEQAAKQGGVEVRVHVVDGVATDITER